MDDVRKHKGWMRRQQESGWRYGPELSVENKTDPLLQPWENLTAEQRVAFRSETLASVETTEGEPTQTTKPKKAGIVSRIKARLKGKTS